MISLSACASRPQTSWSRGKTSSGSHRSSTPSPIISTRRAAERTPLKGLAASGSHTAAIAMRLIVDARPLGPESFGGRGGSDSRWLAPVRPGDVIHLEGEEIELTPSKTKPQEMARIKWMAFNQHGDPVYTVTPIGLVPRRPSG